MAMKVSEIREWLATLPDDTEIGIGDDAMTLRVVGDDVSYCEIGAMPMTQCYCQACPDHDASPHPFGLCCAASMAQEETR